MSTDNSPELTPNILAALRTEPDAVRHIAERLQVKQMGPADHIRTKHEIKSFVASGTFATATDLLKRAQERRELNQVASIRVSQQQGQRMAD